MAAKKPQAEVQWMAQPQALIGCPPGLEYLVQIDRLLVQQQVELLECQSEQESEVHVVLANDIDFQVSSCILDLLTACYYSKVLSANGTQPVGKISKQWSSLVKEYFTDADNFGIQCLMFPFAPGQGSIMMLPCLPGQHHDVALEDSNCRCLGPGRPFSMSITDNNQVEVIHLERPMRCHCGLQEMEVESPPGTIVGYIKPECTLWIPEFTICNELHETILKIRGPCCTCRCCNDVEFQVLSADGTRKVGMISNQWSGLVKEYFTNADNFGIRFPMDLDVKMKAVMLGACFLIDLMYFGRNHDRRY